MKAYSINEVFYSVQGEGMRVGEASIFIRFQGCNLRCAMEAGPKSPGGFDCDTEFESGSKKSLDHLLDEIRLLKADDCKWIVATGGEPALQIDPAFVQWVHSQGRKLAVETNGSLVLPEGIDWITVSPKVAEHAIRQTRATEVKYVRGYGQAIPKTRVDARYKLISPAFDGMDLNARNLQWCIALVKENPEWRLTAQLHKNWNVR